MGLNISPPVPSTHIGDTGAAHGVATTSVAGFLSAADKTKLDGIAAGATAYTHPATHSADIITDGTTNKAYTAAEQTKLAGIATGATAYTDALARAACVSTTITDGVTTSAPNQNAVFDALALKANLASPSFTGTPVFATYDVPFGNSSARSLSIGYSGWSYGGLGYNVQHTATSGVYNAPLSDTSSYICFHAGGIKFLGAASGTAGRSLTFTELAYLPLAGGMTVGANTVIHSGNIASQTVASAGNATTAGGLAVHASRNNEANKLVRTDSSGYVQTGFINTSATVSATAFTHYFGMTATDGYIRPKTLANVQAEIVTAAAVDAAGGGGADKLPLVGGTLTGRLIVAKDIGTASNYSTGQLELKSVNATDDVTLGFHRPGVSAAAFIHRGNGLMLVDSTSTFTQLQAGNVVGDVFSSQSSERIVSPGGGTYSGSGDVTGALAIQLPVGRTNTMITMHIRVYDYAAANRAFDIICGGYNYTSGWTKCFAYMLSNHSAALQYDVAFGYTAGGKSIVYIGTPTSTWSYPKVHVLDVQLGHLGTYTQYLNGWVVSATAAALEGVAVTITVTSPATTTSIPTSDVGGNIWIA